MTTYGVSSFKINDSTFTTNSAYSGGVMETSSKSSFNINDSTFTNNSAIQFGGVIRTFDESSFNINNSTFTNNSAGYQGGVMTTYGESSFKINDSTFTNNSAHSGGVMETSGKSSFNINDSTFTNNSAIHFGGVIETLDKSSFKINNSTFTNNSAHSGGVMETSGNSSFNINNTTFTTNSAIDFGGVIETLDESSFIINDSTFTNNGANVGGVMVIFDESLFIIINSTFTKNSARYGAGVMRIDYESSFNINVCTFTNNSATVFGGVITTFGETNINNSTFTNNSAQIGGVISALGVSSFVINDSKFTNNRAYSYGGTIRISQCSMKIADCTFNQNSGSLFTFISNLTVGGYTKFENCSEPLYKISVMDAFNNQEGGAITSVQSTVIFKGVISLLNNQARCGGAILATASTITMYGETIIANNVATDISGGGICLQQSVFEIKENCKFSNNYAMRGGGIHATSSTIAVREPGTLQFVNNKAVNGSGLYLAVNARLHALKYSPENYLSMIFTGNQANYGGAVYVADETTSSACSHNIECLIQTLSLYGVDVTNTENMFFSGNTATEHGYNIYGGLLDRCIPSPFAEVYRKRNTHYSGVTYLRNISNIAINSIASSPVRVCFCDTNNEPDCCYQPPSIRVKKGEPFNVSLVAVDQVNHTVDTTITSSLSSSRGGLGEGQQTQTARRNCTNITLIVFSPHASETINLFADGPCGSATLSTRQVSVQFLECTCPVGFSELSNSQTESATRCDCDCDPLLSPHITNCNSSTSSLLRMDTNSWITYLNDTDPSGYIIYSNCPFDYCYPQTEKVYMNLNLPNGADAQCDYNRTGLLCGACQKNLSLSLGSSHCLSCHSHWPAVLVTILITFIISGILLVTALLVLNMTVAVGLINGFIFYANIVSAGSAVFFPSSKPSYPSVFVAWLNLDIGIDVCFFVGLDAYTKTWLQLAFPVYIITIVVFVIIASEYSPRLAALIGKRDPIATLATLILLSYAKLLSVTITALSSAVLYYPDGAQQTVWLPDGNVKFFQRKHISLAFVALLIILIGLPYTILLFAWQWIVSAPRWKAFKWTRNTKLNAFITVHHIPYNNKYRYWTGLLLLVRVILYITASATVSAKPQTLPLMTIILVGGLFLLKGYVGLRVYKKLFVEFVDTALYVNILALAAFSQYDFKADLTKQTAVAYTSTIITFILLVGVIIYHVTLLIKKDSLLREEMNMYPLTPVQPTNDEVTHTVIELPKCDQDSPRAPKVEQVDIEGLAITPPYQ